MMDGFPCAPATPAGRDIPELPVAVVAALQRGQKLEAIRLLREVRPLGLHEAKQQVEDFHRYRLPAPAPSWPRRRLVVALLVAFVWALVTSVAAVSNLIVLAHLDGYRAEPFTVAALEHRPDRESGLLWGFAGTIAGRQERLYAPRLADAEQLGFAGLQRRFPPGTVIAAWYNPEVTDTLFQRRGLRVLPYTPDLRAAELGQFLRWVGFCLLPLVVVLLVARRFDRAR